MSRNTAEMTNFSKPGDQNDAAWNYDDILYFDRPKSKHPPMPHSHRAAQFAPFAALKSEPGTEKK